MEMYNFMINEGKGPVSEKFIALNIHDFDAASTFIAGLSYKRNQDKNNILCVFEDKGGTCSTKHAVLRKLALENGQDSVKLMLGIFKMDSKYAPSIKKTLDQYRLAYIPEAHNYLKIGNHYYDFTKPGSGYNDFKSNLLSETEIEHDQITLEKITFHREFLRNWLDNERIGYNLEEIWSVREKCIEDLQKPTKEEPETNFSPVCFQNSPEVRDEYK
ncbi:hypothetical protein [Chryseobacterium shigense]|uniref:Uncharacterized protein n=1 Tax=Chryseobacterium shigense TaxID=297244 RepID=A0A841N5I5_9FLAO|nr:hypothetical protein [Chryseobacterium shigense]MBB6372366.1 hypothetical protein [Chryseobacterium shigense]